MPISHKFDVNTSHLFRQRGFTALVTVVLLLIFAVAIVWGLSFFRTQPYSKELPRSLQQATPKPEPTASQTQTYTNSQFNFSFDGPNTWEVGEITAKNEKTLHSILQLAPKDFKGKIPPIKLLYADNPSNLSIQDLEKKVNPDLVTPVLYSGDDVYMLSGKGMAVNYRAEGDCVAVKCQIYTFSRDKRVYQLVNFPDAKVDNQLNIFNSVLNSFAFSDPPSNNTLGASKSANPSR